MRFVNCIAAVAFVGLSLFVSGASVAAPPPNTNATSGNAKPNAKPNFVLILADDMGYGDIGPFGSKLNRTPVLDRMAREGMKLTQFYCCPTCTPSRAQFMTGCYAQRVSLPTVLWPDSPIGLNHSELTLPALLKQQGYATMCIGKWHLGDQREFLPTHYGFDHYFGLPYSNDMGGGEEWWHPKGPANGGAAGKKLQPSDIGLVHGPLPPLPLVRDLEVAEVVSPDDQDRLTSRYTDEALKFIREHRDQPFFLYFPHTAVHKPLHPGAQFRGKSANGTYGDWVEEIDWSVGRVLDTLHELQLDEKTLVVFTSDNGPWLVPGQGGVAGPLRGGKATTWEGGVREPTIARWPGKIPAGSVCDAVAANFDLLPTFVKLAGGSVPSDRKIDGADLWPLLTGESHESPREAQYYFNGNRLEAVRSGPWKLAIRPQPDVQPGVKPVPPAPKNQGPRLYTVVDDVGEKTDVAAKHPDIVKRLQSLVAKMDADLGVTGGGPGVRPSGRVAHPIPLLASNIPNGEPSATSAAELHPAVAKSLAELRIGDVLDSRRAPQVAGHSLTIAAEIETKAHEGVIVAQGGNTTGYALHLRDGKLVFTVRERKQATDITADETHPGKFAVEARLAADGAMTLTIDGRKVAEGKAAGPLPFQPQENFCVGDDDGNPVGDYGKPTRFSGTIKNLSVVTGPGR